MFRFRCSSAAASFATMREEVFPAFELEVVDDASVPYPGRHGQGNAEEAICQKIEEAIRSTDWE